jgi:hypothetical protein
MRRADRGEARMVPNAAADSIRSRPWRVRETPGSLTVPETSATSDGKDRRVGFVRVSDAVWSVVVSRGRAMTFRPASVPDGWLVVVHPSATSQVHQWEQTAFWVDATSDLSNLPRGRGDRVRAPCRLQSVLSGLRLME